MCPRHCQRQQSAEKNSAKATAEAMRAFSFLQLHLTACLGATH